MSSNESKWTQISLNEPKQTKMDLNEPKRTQKTLNIFKMILNELKIALNERKWVILKMSWKEHKWPQINLNKISFLKKFVPGMHISKRHGIFYNFSSGVINVKNKDKKTFFYSPVSKGF